MGADQRVFDFLHLHGEMVPLDWITPLSNESIESYARRLSKAIDSSEEFILLGVSFGGLLAVEINKILKPRLTVLISSVETKNEMRPIFRWMGKFQAVKLIPLAFLKPPIWLASYLFGTNQKMLLNSIIKDTDPDFARWAIHALLSWKNTTAFDSSFKICGSKDKLFPVLKKNPDAVVIRGGQHFMIVDRADEISRFINQKIESL